MFSKYFRMWAEECLGMPDTDGFNIVKNLTAEERWCYMGLLAMCANRNLQPLVCVSALVGYTDAQISDTLGVTTYVVRRTKEKLIAGGKIDVDSAGVIQILDWPRHAGKYFINRRYLSGEARLWSQEEELKRKELEKEKRKIFLEVIKFMNIRTGMSYRATCEASFKHVSARISEGASLDDFKHVIEVKAQQWLHNPEMEKFLRPATLFNSEKFWGYRQERLVKRQMPAGSCPPSIDWLPEEEAKYGAMVAAEYEAKKKSFMQKNGIEKEEDIDYFKIPTLQEYRRLRIKQLRASREYLV
jgi:uncharacterized phage protein (TIGR02220 family)